MNVESARQEQQESYLKLLAALAASPTAGERAELVAGIGRWVPSAAVIDAIAAVPAWFDDWDVREAIYGNTAASPAVRQRVASALTVIELVRELDDGALSELERSEMREDIRDQIAELDEHDRALVKARLKAKARPKTERPPPAAAAAVDPTLLALMAGFETPAAATPPSIVPFGLDDDSGIVETPVTTPEPAIAPAPPRPETIAPPTAESVAADSAGAPPSAAVDSELVARIASLPLDKKVLFAGDSSDVGILSVLAEEKESSIVEALLDNPHLPEAVVVAAVKNWPARPIELLMKRPRWAHRGAVRTAVLFNPNTHGSEALAIVETVSDARALVEILRSPRILSPPVKQKAKTRLVARYWAMTVPERVGFVRAAGVEIFTDLWEQIFRDEATLTEMLRDTALDLEMVAQVAASSMAPRAVLASVAARAEWTSTGAVARALIKNPKTPREATQRLIAQLSPAEKKELAADSALPPGVRGKLF